MNATEIVQEAVRLPVTERNRIIARLVMANMRDEKEEWDELQRRMDDRDPKNWVSLDEVTAKLLAPGLD
jgi:hypothetical protein